MPHGAPGAMDVLPAIRKCPETEQTGQQGIYGIGSSPKGHLQCGSKVFYFQYPFNPKTHGPICKPFTLSWGSQFPDPGLLNLAYSRRSGPVKSFITALRPSTKVMFVKSMVRDRVSPLFDFSSAFGEFMRPSFAHVTCAALLLTGFLSIANPANAQSDLTRVYGAEDQTVPVPTLVGTLGQKDAAALQELIDYLKAVNIVKWQGMQASGTLIDGSGQSERATLTVLNGDNFRLDVETPHGERSTRISGTYGKTLEADGKSYFLPATTAQAGLLAFPKLLVSTFPRASTSFIDRGQVAIAGQSLHRITLEEPAISNGSTPNLNEISVTDLYFDPTTHLLMKSASSVQLDSADREYYLIVLTYGDYGTVQGGLIPSRYSQSLNGQRQWTLQLNTPNLQPSVDSSYFHF